MAVNNKLAPKAAPAPVTVPSPEKVRVELAVHGRYVRGPMLYERGVAYTVGWEQAKEMLTWASDTGLPVFRMYRERPKVHRNEDGVIARDISNDMRSADLPPRTMAPADAPRPTRIDIGDEAELAAEGIGQLTDEEREAEDQSGVTI